MLSEKWKSSNIGAEENNEGSWACAGELAGSQESSGYSGGCKPDVIKEDWSQVKNKKIVKRKEALLTAPLFHQRKERCCASKLSL